MRLRTKHRTTTADPAQHFDDCFAVYLAVQTATTKTRAPPPRSRSWRATLPKTTGGWSASASGSR
ncbi:hypothetical protein ACSNOJ_10475 [Streptomyces sp. URMC 128]|uniref:hypothetical protein n=1 Tax=Streptomyces sp. URMC 128 TaxID=3423404 RepID=UPI003F19C8CF